MKEITAEQQMRLDILRLVLLDTAAQITIYFVKDEKLRFEIFKDLWHEFGAESTPVARAQKSIQKGKEA
uniref:Uncharacterized protein n=1 Tax=Arsenophonus endosymbiont of Trialeurodes vaporariorum TaxID=235567 RepID=A0A3B0LZZ4_9GAMM